VDETGEGGALRAMAVYLAGPAEIAQHLGIRPNTINQWKVRHLDFPTPVRKLRSGEIWDIREVQAWAVRTGRLEAASADAAATS
jgi:hypothetical protein